MRDYSFGNFLHELRTRRGLTQYQLGSLVGVSDKAVSKWENGSSKPQTNILYRLSEVLGISTDELLSCKYRSQKARNRKGIFAMRKILWNKALDAMHEHYGSHSPLEITNRFLTEQAEMQDTDMIVYLNALAELTTAAAKQKSHIWVRGGIGASFVAYLLNATDVNPLKPHYYCPDCHTVIFDSSADDGWDLPPKQCSCGRNMITDGHNIPFEAYRHVIHRNTSFDVSVSPNFLETAKGILEDYFKDCRLTLLEREADHILTFTVSSDNSNCSITLFADTEFERYQALERATSTTFEDVDFCQNKILSEFKRVNTDNIPEFKSEFTKDLLSKVKPICFRDLLQISGLAHGTGVWFDNADKLIEQGIPASKVIAYRDDVFNYIKEHMLNSGYTDTGFAYKVMEDTRRGLYAKNGIPPETKAQLESIGMNNWFADSISRINYLFPKAHGVTYVKLAATLMWYKIHYPKEYSKIIT